MAKKKPSKYVGSCGIYVLAGRGGERRLLVHRRSRQVSEPNTICAPGGIVERWLCGEDLSDFHSGALKTAVTELREETGVRLDEAQVAELRQLPVDAGAAYWGPAMHRNFCAVLEECPVLAGPERASLHELVRDGMAGIGSPAGDGFHAWVDVRELLQRPDLMPGCRVPLEHLAAADLPGLDSPWELDLGPSAAEVSAGDGADEEELGRPAKRARGAAW